ncbi:hypothetical protein MD588_08815 [Photobacterium sp. SDRW27]|uniref:hypothetical protein n=1 Tax=Photobacterium obscurum TaxID=2829490 RepID=UPI00224341C3|nr:hypothetical protein [Photobacterium obscurum]MCW8328909.1 hypothetical protein [Photobacterium obscurum]
MKSIWAKIKHFLLTPFSKACLVFIALTNLYLVYKWALEYVRKFGDELFEMIGASGSMGENLIALSFTAICGYYTVEAVISIFRRSPKEVQQAPPGLNT